MKKREHHRTTKGQLSLFPDVAFCRGCCRRLTGRESIERQYGPTCWKKATAQKPE